MTSFLQSNTGRGPPQKGKDRGKYEGIFGSHVQDMADALSKDRLNSISLPLGLLQSVFAAQTQGGPILFPLDSAGLVYSGSDPVLLCIWCFTKGDSLKYSCWELEPSGKKSAAVRPPHWGGATWGHYTCRGFQG